jgi:hypothetical protein
MTTSSPLTRQVLDDKVLELLEDAFDKVYVKYDGIEYHMRCRYGKYSIYKWEYKDGKRTSTTIVSKVDRELAVGMMKLLKEPK